MWLAGESAGTGAVKGTRGCSDRELDINFTSLDADKSGSLNVAEVARYLMSLKMAITRKAYEKSFTHVMGVRGAAENFERAAPLVRALQSGEELKPPPRSLAARLGIHLKDKGVKTTDNINAIFKDGDGNGKIIEVEFCEAMAALGFTENVASLYAGFDANKNGSLDLKELVACLKDLSEQATKQLDAEAEVVNAKERMKENCENYMRQGLKLAAEHFREGGKAHNGAAI